jgi:hypothetical protein
MAIGAVFEIVGGTQSDYDKIVDAMIGRPMTQLSDWPTEGILGHIAGPSENGWRVVDVWESEEALQAFSEVLIPAMQEAGLDPPPPQVFQVHNFVKD